MKLSELKIELSQLNDITFRLPGGEAVPQHFHVTEVGSIRKNFIDCGGTLRSEHVINFQLWTANDFDHRLAPQKLNSIILLSEKHLGLEDGEIEVEYQEENTIQKFGLEVINGELQLIAKFTDCLAKDQCGVKEEKPRIKLSSLRQSACCEPGSGCC